MSGSANGGSSFVWQKPAFGSKPPAQTSPFGSAIQSPQPAVGSNIFGSSTPFGASSQPAHGSTTSVFGGQSSAFASPTPTPVFGNLESISAMPVYKDKSHEELRWEDYQLGDKGGPLASTPQSTSMAGFNSSTTPTNAFSPPTTFVSSSTNPFSSTTPNSNNPFAPKTSTFSSGFRTSAPAFSSPAFSFSTSEAASSIFGPSQSLFGLNSSSQPFGSSPSFGANTSSQPSGANTTSSPFDSSIFGNTQSSPLFSSNTPTNPQYGSTFGQNTSPFGPTGVFSQPSLFRPPLLSSSASLISNALTGFGQTAPSMSMPFQTAQPAQSSGTFAVSNFGQTQPGTQTSTQAFTNTAMGQSELGGQRGGSRVASYSATFIEDTISIRADPSIQTEKLESISAIPLHKDKSHEELRWEDYHLGSSAPTNAQSGSEFGQNTFPFGQTAGFRPSDFFGSHSSRLVGSIFSSMASLSSNAPSLAATSMASLTSNAPSLAILTGTVVVTVVVTRWISLRSGRA